MHADGDDPCALFNIIVGKVCKCDALPLLLLCSGISPILLSVIIGDRVGDSHLKENSITAIVRSGDIVCGVQSYSQSLGCTA